MSNSVSASAAVTPPGSPPGRARAPAARRRLDTALDRTEPDRRPREQPAGLHGGVGGEAVAAHRLDAAVATPRRRPRGPATATDGCRGRGAERTRSSRAHRCAYSSQRLAGLRPAARGRRGADRRRRRAARPCCRRGCRAGRATRRVGPTTLRMLTASSPDSSKISTAAVTISSASSSKLGRLGGGRHGTITSLPTTRAVGHVAAAPPAARANGTSACTALRSRPSATSAASCAWIASSSSRV